MSRFRLAALLVPISLAAVSASPPAAAAGEARLVPQAPPQVVGLRQSTADRAAAMLALQERLAADRVDAALARPFRVELTALERQRIDADGTLERRYLVGIARPVGADVALAAGRIAGAEVAVGPGVARDRGAGELVWTAAFEAPGATGLRLYLRGLDLPKGAELYVYNLAGKAFGPYTGRGPLGDGELFTHTVAGDRLLLQLHWAGDRERALAFRVEEVGVLGQRFQLGLFGIRSGSSLELLPMASNLCSYNADCIVNAACQSSSVVNTAKDAVASILFRSGGSYYICTGGLVADTVASSTIPYFLTANHCISSGNEASSVETYFDYATTCSNPDCTQPYNDTGETVGATLRSHSSSNDHSLLQLSSSPITPDGVAAYLGWTTTAVANADGTQLYRISHPAGAPQAYSEQRVDTDKPTCGTLPRGRYIYSTDTVGGTEGGSSGSPVVNGAGQIVGQLYGACGFDVGDPCNAADNATVDGAFADSYSSMAPFLNPGGGGSCSPAGASCTANADCCSGSCKGRPGARTCR